jgi:hypothetical protein
LAHRACELVVKENKEAIKMKKMSKGKNRNIRHYGGVMRPHRKAPTHYYPARIRPESSSEELAKEHGREAAQPWHRVRR